MCGGGAFSNVRGVEIDRHKDTRRVGVAISTTTTLEDFRPNLRVNPLVLLAIVFHYLRRACCELLRILCEQGLKALLFCAVLRVPVADGTNHQQDDAGAALNVHARTRRIIQGQITRV